ncbi:hypothetical protein D9M71_489300 [compost metagenome]
MHPRSFPRHLFIPYLADIQTLVSGTGFIQVSLQRFEVWGGLCVVIGLISRHNSRASDQRRQHGRSTKNQVAWFEVRGHEVKGFKVLQRCQGLDQRHIGVVEHTRGLLQVAVIPECYEFFVKTLLLLQERPGVDYLLQPGPEAHEAGT